MNNFKFSWWVPYAYLEIVKAARHAAILYWFGIQGEKFQSYKNLKMEGKKNYILNF